MNDKARLKLAVTKQFKRDLKKIIKQGKSKQALNDVIDMLQQRQVLPSKYRDHALLGNYSSFRECHISPDWLLIYRVKAETTVQLLELARTGSHSGLFG